MVLRTCTSVFLSISKLRFLSTKSILKIINDCYDENALKLNHRFERTDLYLPANSMIFEFYEVLFRKRFNTDFFAF